MYFASVRISCCLITRNHPPQLLGASFTLLRARLVRSTAVPRIQRSSSAVATNSSIFVLFFTTIIALLPPGAFWLPHSPSGQTASQYNLASPRHLPVRLFTPPPRPRLPCLQYSKRLFYFALNTGLGAPVGSAVAGSADFISRALRVRKALGGGMRQSGVVAAAALEGLRKQLPRIGEDHVNAKRLAQVHVICNVRRSNRLRYFDIWVVVVVVVVNGF